MKSAQLGSAGRRPWFMAPVFRSALFALALATPCSALGVRLSAQMQQGRYQRGFGALLVIDLPVARWLSPAPPPRRSAFDEPFERGPFGDPRGSVVWFDDLPMHEWDREAELSAAYEALSGSASEPGDALNDDARGVTPNPKNRAAGTPPWMPSWASEGGERAPGAADPLEGVGPAGPWALGAFAEGPAPAEAGEQGAAPAPSGSAAPSPPAPTAAGKTERPRLWQLSTHFVVLVVRAALRESNRGAKRLDDLQDRARTSAWLPQMRARAGRNTDETLRLTPTTDDPDRWQLTGGADLRLELQLAWEFDRLLFASEELNVERSRLMLEQRRQRQVEQILQLLFDWQAATLRASDPWLEAEQVLLAQLRAEQAARALDWYTGGWFGRHLPAEQARQGGKR